MTRPLSLAALTVLELSPPEMVSCAAQAGYSHVGLRLIPATPEEPQYPIIGATPIVRETLKRLDDTGVKVLDVEIFRLKPDTRVADYEPAMETGARLGASDLLVAGNDPDEGRLIERFAEFCDTAAKFGLNASLEFMPWTDARNLLQAARIVGTADRPNSGVLIDAFHLDRSGSHIEDIAQVPREWLHFMQLCDIPAERPANMDGIIAEARAERLFPGKGGLDLLGLLRALPRDIPISVEVPTVKLAQTISAVERARRALVATKTLLAKLDELDQADRSIPV
jgi:sugar phosphate isomerase/epimerase